MNMLPPSVRNQTTGLTPPTRPLSIRPVPDTRPPVSRQLTTAERTNPYTIAYFRFEEEIRNLWDGGGAAQ